MSKLSERRREIQAMDMASAQDELKALRRRLFELRLQKERGEVKNNRLFPQTKADIARLMHHLGELNHAAELEAAGLLTSEAAESSEAPKRPATETPAARRASKATQAATTPAAAATPTTATTTTPATPATPATPVASAATDEADETDETDETTTGEEG